MQKFATVVMMSAAMTLSGCNAFNATLPTSEVEAAKTCWPVASIVGQSDKSFNLAEMSEIMLYAAVAAKSVPGNAKFSDKVATVTNTPPADQAKLGVNADALLQQCRARFPAAAATAVTLPSDAIDRGMWCLVAADYLTGAMSGAKEENYPEKDRLARVSKVATNSLNDALLATRGIATADQFVSYREKVSEPAMANRLDRIAAACPDS